MMKKQRTNARRPSGSDRLARSADLLNALSNPARLEILEVLESGEISVGALNKRVVLSQSSLSQHLAVLRGQKLVSTRRDAQMVYYTLDAPHAVKLLQCLREIYSEQEQDQVGLGKAVQL